MVMTRFNGFSPSTLSFLKKLSENNNRTWFEAHRKEYEDSLLKPLRELSSELGGFMITIDAAFEVRPNRTVSRIYRDTRFSHDKSPYKSAMWVTFKRPGGDWRDAPAYFFEISPGLYRYGMGFYCASAATMRAFREVIDEKPVQFEKAISFFAKQDEFVIVGEKYKRVLDRSKPDKINEWYQRKNIYLSCNREIDDRLFCRELIGELTSGFGLLRPLYNFFRKIKSTK